MTLALLQTDLYEQLNNPNNPAFDFLSDERLQRDTWNIRQDLPPLAEEAQLTGRKTIRFDSICLVWLKDLLKLVALVTVGNRRWSLSHLSSVICQTKDFACWLFKQGYVTPTALCTQVVQQWSQSKSCHTKQSLYSLLKILQQLGCIHFQMPSIKTEYSRNINTIPEEVKQKLDLAIEKLDKPIYLVLKLHAALGTRSIEIGKIPLDCLRLREGVYRIRISTGKQDGSEQEQDLPEELVPLVQEQQAFIRQQFGFYFSWLFSNWKWVSDGFGYQSRPPKLKYDGEQLKSVNKKLNRLLKKLIEEHDIRSNDGKLARVTTHMFRRTWATVADRMGKRSDQIMHGLRQCNLDMQDSYVNVPPLQQEKHTKRVLVNRTGKRTIYRTDRDVDLLKKEWQARQVETGVCTRPSIQVECEFEYVCLGCDYCHYAIEHLPRLLEVREENQRLLKRCIELGQSNSRRAHSAHQFISILDPIIASLQGKEEVT